VPGRIGDQQVAVREFDRLAGEAQQRVGRDGWHVRAVAAVQRAVRAMLGDQLVEQAGQALGVPLAGHRGDQVAGRIDHRERRPRLRRVLLPEMHVDVVDHRMVHAVALHRGGQRGRVAFVLELG
jgi:hypothetical protein